MKNNDKDMTNQDIQTAVQTDELYQSIADLIERARMHVSQTANLTLVYTNYEIGRLIVEKEQGGKQRAEYGKKVLQGVSERLTERFGRGYSYPSLKRFRQFYMAYSCQPAISSTALSQLEEQENCSTALSKSAAIGSTPLSQSERPVFTLGWSHYLQLLKVDNPEARRFYEIEATKEQWNHKFLGRQIGSSLYERLALSRNKDEVMRLASEGNVVAKPQDIMKEPFVLEFLGMEEKATYTETDLEHAILDKIQKFLMEMGKGFLFEARQKRFTFDDEHFFVDLVLYNRLLQCYVLIDLKTGRASHQELGQMQMYVNYYDRFVKQDFENPTIGILLCQDKNQAAVEITLPKDSNIYAQQYSLYLPDKKLLQAKLAQWIEEGGNS